MIGPNRAEALLNCISGIIVPVRRIMFDNKELAGRAPASDRLSWRAAFKIWSSFLADGSRKPARRTRPPVQGTALGAAMFWSARPEIAEREAAGA